MTFLSLKEEYQVIEAEQTREHGEQGNAAVHNNSSNKRNSGVNPHSVAERKTPAFYQMQKADGSRTDDGKLKLKELTPRHEEMIAMHLDGMRNKDIAEYFRVSDVNVSLVLSDPLAVALIHSARKENEGRFASLYGKSIDVIEAAVSSGESIDVRLKGAGLYFKEAGNQTSDEKQTAEDVVQQIINMQINGDLTVIQEKS